MAAFVIALLAGLLLFVTGWLVDLVRASSDLLIEVCELRAYRARDEYTLAAGAELCAAIADLELVSSDDEPRLAAAVAAWRQAVDNPVSRRVRERTRPLPEPLTPWNHRHAAP